MGPGHLISKLWGGSNESQAFYRAACNVHNEKTVRPSVRLSVKRVNYDKMEERSVQIFIPYERPYSLVF